jgi:cytochrome P450
MLLFLSAGYGTTSASLVWFIFFISKYPNVQNKIKKELSEYDRQRLSIEQLDSLIYLESVIREVLRCVPPAIGAVRTVIADDQLPATGAHLIKGDHIFIPAYSFNRDPRNCPGPINPNQFYPERFLITDNANNNKIASMTFGGGQRQCIGQDFARFELKTICARLMQHVTFGDGGNQLNAGGYKQTDTLLPKHIGVTITFD